jgi:membrane protease YdiL (CAAX protease family)
VGSLFKFFSLTFLVTWTCFLSVVALSVHGELGTVQRVERGLLLFVGIFAPSFVAMGLTAWSEGRAGLVALLRRLFQWQVGARWYAFAVAYMAVIKLTAALVVRVATGAWPRFGQEAWFVMLAATLFSTVVGGQAGEELGWRGYALPRMATRLGLGAASLLLGLFWALWHLPLFYLPGADTYRQSFPVYALQVTALSVAFAWLYARTKGSLLLTMLLHAAINNTKDVVPSIAAPTATHPFTLRATPVGWITLALLSIAAAYFLLRMPRLNEDAASTVPRS